MPLKSAREHRARNGHGHSTPSLLDRTLGLLIGASLLGGILYIANVSITGADGEAPRGTVQLELVPEPGAEERVLARQRLQQEIERQSARATFHADAVDREALKERMEAAWAAYWRPSEHCLQATSVECGNEYIRARREFEQRFIAGENR